MPRFQKKQEKQEKQEMTRTRHAPSPDRGTLIQRANGLFGRAQNWALQEGSTRPIAVLRILAVGILWTKWGHVGALHRVYPDAELLLLAVGFYAFSGLLLIGYQTRAAAVLCALLLFYGYHVLGVEGGERRLWVHHHTNLLKYLFWLLALTPCGRSFSLDRILEVRAAAKAGVEPRPEKAPLWGQRLIAVQLFSMYAWAAIAKLDPAFLSGARMEAYLTEFYFGADVPDEMWFHLLSGTLGTGTVLLEASLAIAVLWPRFQAWVLPAGVALHLGFYMLLPVATFSATVVAMYIAVIPPEKWEKWLV